MDDELRQAVLHASARADVRDAVDAIYTSLAQAIEVRRPICRTSGRCCRFEEFGHRMYVTTLELAKFAFDLSVVPSPPATSLVESLSVVKAPNLLTKRSLTVFTTDNDSTKLAAGGQLTTDKSDRPGCPFQIDGLCSVHTLRPFGCRVFFCDATAQDWQHQQYEQHHSHLRRLHEDLDVPYFYVEWRVALKALGLAERGSKPA